MNKNKLSRLPGGLLILRFFFRFSCVCRLGSSRLVVCLRRLFVSYCFVSCSFRFVSFRLNVLSLCFRFGHPACYNHSMQLSLGVVGSVLNKFEFDSHPIRIRLEFDSISIRVARGANTAASAHCEPVAGSCPGGGAVR